MSTNSQQAKIGGLKANPLLISTNDNIKKPRHSLAPGMTESLKFNKKLQDSMKQDEVISN